MYPTGANGDMSMPSLHNHELSELIGSIYDAAAKPALWPQFLAALARTTGSSKALMFMHNSKRAEHTVSSSWGTEATELRLYQEHYGALDVWASQGSSKPAGQICTSEMLCPLQDLVRTEIYNDYMRPFDVKHGMFGMLANQAGAFTTVSILRDSSAGQFLEPQLQTLSLLVPHIQRAFCIHFRLVGLNAQAAGFESALDMLQFGVVFVSSTQAVIFMNERAKRHIRSSNGLRVRAGKLTLIKPSESNLFQSLISGAVKTGSGNGFSAGGTMHASRNSGSSLCLTIAPLRLTEWPMQPTAVIFISDPHEPRELPADLLRRCYGLTQAESRLVLLLVEGCSVKEAAASLQVTLNTAKTQLKSVFAKTRVRRQGELIKLLLCSGGFVRQS
jgi:DNA-binding CsgD family transcriptional regulator